MSQIFITEKVSVAREYKKILGLQENGKTDGYFEGYSTYLNDNVIITWAIGHLVSLCSPEEHNEEWKHWSKSNLPMIPEHFQYKVIDDKEHRIAKQFKIVKSLYTRNDISRIYYAGDSGREGIYIQALIRNVIFKGKDPSFDERVVWINSFTDKEIKRGINEAKPYHDYDRMIQSGYARAITDWLIGMNFTIGFTLVCGGKRVINTGRVKTPTLAMVVKRQEEIDNFVKTDYYGISADTPIGSVNWKAVEGSRYYQSDDLYNDNGFLKEEVAAELVKEFEQSMQLLIESVEVERKKDYAPAFFNQTDLQAYCSKTLHISPADTLACAQRLYEQKHISYPRTSARVISEAVAEDLKLKGYNIPRMKKYIDDNKIEDHYAIIPTFETNTSSISGLDAKVYEFILKRFMDTMKPPFEYDAVSIAYKHNNGERFFNSFKNVINKGWKETLSDDEQGHKEIPKEGTAVPVSAYVIRNMETTPPSPYTTGSLVTEMEKAGKFIDDKELKSMLKGSGIGTDATRAGIIDELIKREFISVDKKQVVSPTDFGKAVVAIVAKYDEQLISPIKTAELESDLSEIVDGTVAYSSFMQKIKTYVSDTTKRIAQGKEVQFESNGNSSEPLPNCPHCGQPLAFGKFGVYCTGKCGASLAKVYGHDLTEKQLRDLLAGKSISYTSKGKSTTVLPEIVPNEWNGKTYFVWKVASAANSNSASTADNSDLPACPRCGQKLAHGNYGIYCTGKCGVNLAKVYGHELSDAQVKSLLSGKSVSFTAKGKKTTVLPEIIPNEWNGKTYYNWKTEGK